MTLRTIQRIAAVIALSLPLAAAQADGGGPMTKYAPPLTPELKARLTQADLDAGARYFERKCSQCHDGVKTGGHAKGPFLWNVFGRKAGTIPGFEFSPAMKGVGIAWNFATLDYYLADTERAVPGKAMNFTGITDDALRAAVVVFVSRLGDSPPPLPQ
jgi:cytochrome c